MIFEQGELDEFEKEAWLLLDYKHKPTKPSRVAFYRDTDRSYFIGGTGKTKAIYSHNIVVPLKKGADNHCRMIVITNFHRDRLGKIYYFLSHLREEKEVWDLVGFTLIHSYKDGEYTFDSTVDHFGRNAPSGKYEPMGTEELLESIRGLVHHPYVDITFRNQGVDVLSGYGTTGMKLLLACKRSITHFDLLENEPIIRKMFEDSTRDGTLLLSSVEVDRLFGLMKIFFVESYTRTVFLGTCDKLGIFEPFFEFARAENLDCSKKTKHALSRYGSLGLAHELTIKAIAPGFRSKMNFRTMGWFLELAENITEYKGGICKSYIDKVVYMLNNLDKIKTTLSFEEMIAYFHDVMEKEGIDKCLKDIKRYSEKKIRSLRKEA